MVAERPIVEGMHLSGRRSHACCKGLMMTNSPAISLKNVHLTLGEGAGRVHILKGIDLEIDKGTSVGLVGPSGSGKSTLLMVMAGLERADEGSVVVANAELGPLSEDRLARFRGRNVGIIFQSFHLVPNMTALENVAVPLELAGDPSAFDKAKAELDAVGLGHRLHHYPAQMSGGEQQRVAVARALVVEPEILIADEPTGNLDDTTGTQIVDLMFAAQRERNTTLVLVTHDPNLAVKCDRMIRVRSGEIEEAHAKPSDVAEGVSA
jgi:putative ABC transport system ATP-binding protein